MAQNINISTLNIEERNAYIANLNTKFKAMVEAANADPYKNTIPTIIERIAEVGAENVFYISKNYRGLYEDDFCSFLYWDNANGEYVWDEWGTNFAYPNFDLYTEDVICYDDAKKAGLVNMDLVYANRLKNMRERIKRMEFNDNIKKDMIAMNPRIKVDGGRKFKGEGYLVEVITEESVYGTRMIAKVLSLVDFQIHYCNYKYVKFVDGEKLVEDYKAYMNDIMNHHESNKTLDRLFNVADIHNMSEVSGDLAMTFADFIKDRKNHIEYLVATAPDPEIEEKKKKTAQYRAENYNTIVEWVKNNTDKTTDEEIAALALRILNKRY